jgi:hypothetical protein
MRMKCANSLRVAAAITNSRSSVRPRRIADEVDSIARIFQGDQLKKNIIAALAAVAFSGAALAQKDPASMSIADINSCMKQNSVSGSSVRDITLDSVDKEGVAKVVKIRGYFSPAADGSARVNLRVVEPPVLSGSAYLVLQKKPEDQVYLYLAFLKSVTAIKPSEMTNPLWGTGVSYVELKQVQGLLESGNSTRQADAAIGGRPVYNISTATDFDSIGYRRVVSYVDQATCLLLKAEFYVKGNDPLKILDADVSTISASGPPHSVTRMLLRNPRENSHTTMTLGPLAPINGLSDALFDASSFYSAPAP